MTPAPWQPARLRPPRPTAFALALSLAAVAIASAATSSIPMIDAPMAHVLRKGDLELTLHKDRINDTLDFFGVKESQIAGIAPAAGLDLGAIGDLDGNRLTANFGLGHRLLFRFVGKQQDLAFGRGTAHRVGAELGIRNIILRENKNRPAMSIEAIYRDNRGSGITRQFTEVEAFSLVVRFPAPVTLRLGGVHDESWGLRALASKQLTGRLLLSLWAETSKVYVDTEVQTDIPVNTIRNLLNSLQYDSDQLVLGGGAHYIISPRLVGYADFQHYDIDRSINASIPNVVDTNDVFRGRITYRMSPVAWLSAEGNYFANQLGGEVPFLFNTLSASRFDKIYGYVGLGLTVQTSYGRN